MDYTPNSNKYKAEQQKATVEERRGAKVVTGPVKVRKKSEVRKFADSIVASDVGNVRDHLLADVLIPAAKKLLWDIITDAADMFLYGSTGKSKSRFSQTGSGNYIPYSSYSAPRNDRFSNSSNRHSTRFDYDDIIYTDRGQAEAVLRQMDETIGRYGYVTVLEMFDMAELTAPYTSNRYGWNSLRSAEVVRVRDGYIIKLPKPFPID